jgi:hypothetical protein
MQEKEVNSALRETIPFKQDKYGGGRGDNDAMATRI